MQAHPLTGLSRTLNRTEPSLTSSVTPVLVLPRRVKKSAVTLERSHIILYSVTPRLASGSLTGEPVIFF